MTNEQLISHLKTFDKDLPVYIGIYENRTPYDPNDTDLSEYVPQKLSITDVNQRDRTICMTKSVKIPHIYIGY